MHSILLRPFICVLLIVPLLSCLSESSGSKVEDREYTVQEADSLCKIAKEFYGNCHLGTALMFHNEIRSNDNSYTEIIPVGKVIKVPDLATLLKREGLSKVVETEVDLIVKAWSLYYKNETEIMELHKKHYAERSVDLPRKIKDDLLSAIGNIHLAVSGLKKKRGEVKKIPEKTIGQLKSFSGGLKGLSDGHIEFGGYDILMIHKNFANAISYIIVWSENNFE